MDSAHRFLEALTVVLCTAAVTILIFQRLKLPVVLGYILAGLIAGPHVPIPLVADEQVVRTLSELGVVLLMFSLGLEFSLRKLAQVVPTAGLTAVVETSFLIWLGFNVGRWLDWTVRESLFTGTLVAISSTTIIAKAFEEQKVKGHLRQFVVGILIVEDLIAILAMALLTAFAAGDGVSLATLGRSGGRLLLFLVGTLAVGLLIVPRATRAIVAMGRPETTLIASIGLCFACSLLAHSLGYSVALGAFLAGSLVAESGKAHDVERVVNPVRDMFAAIFFVSVGMLIDPVLIAREWKAVALLTALVIGGKVFAVTIGAFLSGQGTRTSVRAGMSLAQIGEFSFIIAGLGVTLSATRDFLYPIAVAVSAVTTLTTPWLIRASGPTASYLDRKLPRRVQTFAALYGSWLEHMRSPGQPDSQAASIKRFFRFLILDAALLAIVIIAAVELQDDVTGWLAGHLGLSPRSLRIVVIVGAVCAAGPFAFGIVRIARQLGLALARTALPEALEGRVDPSAAPRGSFVVTLQLAIVLLVGLPVMALTQPFLSGLPAASVLAAFLVFLVVVAIAFWRSANDLEGHVRAGAQAILETLAAQTATGDSASIEPSLTQIHTLLPGLGDPQPVVLLPGSPAVGRSLAELDLRGLTGATVLTIHRGERQVVIPSAHEHLGAGDILALAGTQEAIAAAKRLLLVGGNEPPEPADSAAAP